jgi:hypothetical protein
MGLMNQPLQNSTYPDMFPDFSMLGGPNKDIHQQPQSRSQVIQIFSIPPHTCIPSYILSCISFSFEFFLYLPVYI